MEDETRSILFSSHNTLDVEQISDHITFIQRGQVISSEDKETFLDSWRRLRLVVPDDYVMPELPDIVETQRSGHQVVITSSNFTASLEERIRNTGATINEVQRLTLEEIFIASVQNADDEDVADTSADGRTHTVAATAPAKAGGTAA